MKQIKQSKIVNCDSKQEWTKPELVDLDSEMADVESGIGTMLDGGDNFTS